MELTERQAEALRDIRDGKVVWFARSHVGEGTPSSFVTRGAHAGVVKRLRSEGLVETTNEPAPRQHHSAIHTRYKVKITAAGTEALTERWRATTHG